MAATCLGPRYLCECERGDRERRSLARSGGSRGGGGGPPAEDVLKLVEDELHRLVLENHVHRHVAVVALGPQQRGPEDDADVLRCHAVGV